MTTDSTQQPSGTPADPPQQPQAGTPNSQPQPTPPAGGGTTQPNTPATPPATPAPQAGANDEPMSLEEAKKLRQEAHALRERLKKIDADAAAAELAKLGDLERAKKQLETATAQATAYRDAIAAMAVQLEATKLGFIDPADAATFLAGKLELDESGKPTNADKLLKELLKAKPYLVQQQMPPPNQPGTPGAPNLGATNPGRGTGGQPAQQAIDPSQVARFGQGRNLFKTGNS